MTRPEWDFEYLGLSRGDGAPEADDDFVVATCTETRPDALARALRTKRDDVQVEALLVRAPLFWYRVRTASPRRLEDVSIALGAVGVGTRYVTSSARTNLALGARADFLQAPPVSRRPWRPGRIDEAPARHWFLGRDAGVDVDRALCGTGSGTHLAVIDDEAREAETLDLDAEVSVGVSAPPRGSSHGAAMVAWAVGSRGDPARGLRAYAGVAPGAASRLYVIPRPGQAVVWLPLAIVRAVDDGAHVVVCATYVEGTTSPLLDDALEFAVRLGRGGLGTAVVLPTGREISSPPGSVHASLTLGLGDPASDPRVVCIAPSGRNGGWFLWTDKTGRRRPFANRGPAVRLAAPGDDMAYPFATDGRLGHAESSGASAIAAGVALLVLAVNADLRIDELQGLLASTARACAGDPEGPIADPADLLPAGRDADGHDAKCGYGRISAVRACLASSDPIAASLVAMGDEGAARRFMLLRKNARSVSAAYSDALAKWSARVLRGDAILSHALCTVLRHLRLLVGHVDRRHGHAPGATAHALSLLVGRLASHSAPEHVGAEVQSLHDRAREATRHFDVGRKLEDALFSLASELWTAAEPLGSPPGAVGAPHPAGVGDRSR